MPTTSETNLATARRSGLPSSRTLPPHLQKAMSRVTEINSLPEITTRIVEVVEDPRATAQDMHDIVKNDPALATKILKVVNSAFYGLPSQIASLDRAIVMLGLSAVKNIALAASLARLFKGDAISAQFTARDLWRHCIAVGVCARALAAKAKNAAADEYFVAGLVHDMGMLISGQLFPEKFGLVADNCLARPRDFCAAERETIGADHQSFGAVLAAKWKFPPALCYVIAYHHDPHQLQPEFRKIATTVYVADTICGKIKHGFYLTSQTQEITEDMLAFIKLDAKAMGEVCEVMPERVEEAEQILGEA